MAEYTPGSWEVNERGQVIDAKSPDDIICEPPMEWSDATCSWEPADSMDHWEANARLIAAAPDLLAALIEVKDTVMDYDPALWLRVDAAITRATQPDA